MHKKIRLQTRWFAWDLILLFVKIVTWLKREGIHVTDKQIDKTIKFLLRKGIKVSRA